MSHSKTKSLILTSILLCSSLALAQEANDTMNDNESGDPDTCQPFPSCAHQSMGSNSLPTEERSAWSKLWEELTKEAKENTQDMNLQPK